MMNRTELVKAMGNEIANIQWAWHSTHKVSGAAVLFVWKFPGWVRRVDGKDYVVASYPKSEFFSGKLGHWPLYRVVHESDAPLFCVYMYPTKASAKIMARHERGPGSPIGPTLHASHYGLFVYELDRDDRIVDDCGTLWLRVIPGFRTLGQFNAEQCKKSTTNA